MMNIFSQSISKKLRFSFHFSIKTNMWITLIVISIYFQAVLYMTAVHHVDACFRYVKIQQTIAVHHGPNIYDMNIL
jgi:hypothetical protein